MTRTDSKSTWNSLLFCAVIIAVQNIMLSLSLSAQSFAVADTTRGIIGDELFIPVTIDSVSTKSISFNSVLRFKNPTVVYPLRIEYDSLASDWNIRAYTLKRRNDSTWLLSLSAESNTPSNKPLNFNFYFEALAGSDSTTAIIFDSISINSTKVFPTIATCITRSISGVLPYVRFARLEYGYPNPAPVQSTITWAYQLDKQSEVEFIFYNLLGRVLRHDVFQQSLGVHLYTLTTDINMPPGAYMLRMKSNSGEAVQGCVIIGR
jgi:hypothetical protein